MAVTMGNAVFWDVAPWGGLVRTDVSKECIVSFYRTAACYPTANAVPRSWISSVLYMQAKRFPETSVPQDLQGNIPEDECSLQGMGFVVYPVYIR
jgi:hypothetical protein